MKVETKDERLERMEMIQGWLVERIEYMEKELAW